uniref:Ig-like domain-containing protein n=1 Tax=Meloidogyne incognita TaxID=6306 RepID=A0A914NAJ1_MELIC
MYHRPTANDAGQYRCNIKNDQGETNANLKLDFQQEEAPSDSGSRRSKTPSRPGTPSSKKHREGTPGEKRERRHKSKSREGSPKKHIRSRTATPTQEAEGGLKPPGADTSREPTPKKSRKALESADKDGLPPAPKERTRRSRSRSKTPARQGPEGHKRAPVVVEPLKSQIVHTNESVKLECELQCHTSTKISWTKDGKKIVSTSTSGYSATFDGKIAKLEINRMTEEKSGLYKCIANSDYGEAQSSAMIKWENSEEEKKKMDLDIQEKTQKRRKSKSPKPQGDEDQIVPEKRVQIHSPSPSVDGSTTNERRVPTEVVVTVEDGIPSSGLKIPPERRKELIRMSGGAGGEESDEDITESISEQPQKKDAKKPSVTINEPPQKSKGEVGEFFFNSN